VGQARDQRAAPALKQLIWLEIATEYSENTEYTVSRLSASIGVADGIRTRPQT